MREKTIASNKIISHVKTTLAFEGLKPSRSGTAISHKFLQGKISSKEAVHMNWGRFSTLYIQISKKD